jgi:hypothetical protein
MDDDVLRQVVQGPLRDPEVRALDDDALGEALRDRGFELDELELKAVRQIRTQAEGLEGEELDRFLDAQVDQDIAEDLQVQGPDLDVADEASSS